MSHKPQVISHKPGVKLKPKNKSRSGFSVLEIVVVLAALAMVAVVLGQLSVSFLGAVASGELQLRANAIGAETMEALKIIKEEDWNNLAGLSVNTPYYLTYSTITNKWSVAALDPGKIDGIFSRWFMVKSVNRDGTTGQIVFSGGSPDSKTLLVEANVDWVYKGANKNFKLTTYLTSF
ncbi:MAG: type II secretion system protein [Patescibacteria group bacterium]